MHYIVVPPGSESYEIFVKNINVWWTILSRETLRMSANPVAWYEYIIAFIVNFCRVIFNYFYMILILLFIIIAILYNKQILKLVKRYSTLR